MISLSKENIQSAIEIEKSLKVCKIKMIKKVFNAIERRIDKNKLSNINSYDYDNFKVVNNYYDKKKSTYPGISYFVKHVKDDIDMCFRIEIGNFIWAGFCTPDKGIDNATKLTKNEIRQLLPSYDPDIDGWWIYWEYLPNNNQIESPNFKDFNDAYLDLFDENKFEEFINRCMDSIEKMMKNSSVSK